MSFLTQGKTNWKFLLIVIVLAVIAGGGIYYLLSDKEPMPHGCTMEAYICPDGTAVGRTGPNCEFAECPSLSTPDETASWQTYRNKKYGIEFKYPNSWILDDKEVLSISLPDQTKNFIQINVSNGVSGPEDESMSPCQPDIASIVYQVNKLRDNQQIFEEFINFQIENPERGIPPAIKPKLIQTTIGGHNALKIEEMINDCEKEFYYVDQSSSRYATISFIVDKNEDKFIIDQIISTSRFIEDEPYIKVLFPNGGETLMFMEKYEIKWESSGVDKIGSIILIDESKGWECGISTVDAPASIGKHEWMAIPVVCDPGYKFKIKIISSDGKISGESEAYFTMADMYNSHPSSFFDICLTKGYKPTEFPPILQSDPKQCKDLEGNIIVEELERDIDAEKAKWSFCNIPDDIKGAVNSFNCPDWMQDINWNRDYQDDATLKFYFYNSLDKEKQRAYLSKKTGGIAFMVENIIKKDIWEYYGSNSIKFIYPNREIVTLYKNHINVYYEQLSDIRFSPDGQYVAFILRVHDGERNSIIGVNTGGDILADYNDFSRQGKDMIYFDLEGLVWSGDSKYVAINGRFGGGYGAYGSESIYLGNMAKGGRLTKVFRVELERTEDTWEYPKTTELRFDKDYKNIYFSVETSSEETKYKYNIADEKLVIIEELLLP